MIALAPPLSMTDEDADHIVEALGAVLRRAFEQGVPA